MSSTEHTEKAESSEAESDPGAIRLKHGIEQTRAGMAATISALETRLSPSEIREKVGAELEHVEDRIRAIAREQLREAKTLVQDELLEAKTLLRSEMDDAEEKLKRGLAEAKESFKSGLIEAKESVKEDLRDAFVDAKGSLRAATIGRVEDLATTLGDKMNNTRDTLVDTIRKNPVPATVVGVGLVWLLMNRSKAEASRSRAEWAGDRPAGVVGNVVGELGGAIAKAAHQTTEATGGVLHQATDAAGTLLHQASTAAGTALHGASDLAGRIAAQSSDKAKDLAHRANDLTSRFARQAGDAATYVAGGARKGVESATKSLRTTLHENPIALGTASLAFGTVVGFSLPRTRGEDVFMGGARERVVQLAGEAAHEAAASVTHLAEQTVAGAKKTMSESNPSRQ